LAGDPLKSLAFSLSVGAAERKRGMKNEAINSKLPDAGRAQPREETREEDPKRIRWRKREEGLVI